MQFRILGAIEAVESGVTLSLKGPRIRLLLAVLLAHAGERVSTDYLVNTFWGDTPPDNARALLQVRVSELRQALTLDPKNPFSGLVTHSSGYQILITSPDELDAWAFERLLDQGQNFLRRGEFLATYRILEQALVLWRGSPFEEFEDRPFTATLSAHLQALHLQALEDQLAVALALGRHNEVVTKAGPLVAKHPLREGLWFQLMLAQYRAGRQGEALRSYEKARELLSEQLGIDPGQELQNLHLGILRQDPALDLDLPLVATQKPRHNLPAEMTSFVGREWELNEVRAMLSGNRLVTLVGGGGAGKSRLALEVALNALEDFPDGVWLVELPPLGQPGIAAQTLAKTVGLAEHPVVPIEEVIEDRLQQEKILLILDGCEYLVGEVSALAYRLLRSCPNVSILATTQERLGITGEALRPLAGLDVPDDKDAELPALLQSGSVNLFVERASTLQPGFRLDNSNSQAVIAICQRLDGLPLAIELAAALMNSMDVHMISQRLNDRYDLLNRPTHSPVARHQTLRAVADWSYGLLNLAERQLFDNLAVFVGGFTLEAAESVVDWDEQPGEPVALTLSRLVDKSLVVSEDRPGAGRRYRLLDSLRVFGLERLQSSNKLESTQVLHAAYYRSLAEQAAPALRGPDQRIWLDRLNSDHDNLRAALETAIHTGDFETAARIAGSLYPFWDLHGHYSEGRRWIDKILAGHHQISNESRTRVLLGAATLAVAQGDPQTTVSACREAVGLARGTGDRASLSHALQFLGLCSMFQGELEEAESLLEESLEHATAVQDPWLELSTMVIMSAVALSRSQYEQAGILASKALSVSERHLDPEFSGWATLSLAGSHWYCGRRTHAVPLIREGFQIFERLGGLWGLSFAIFMAAEVSGARGNIPQQVMLMGASEQLRSSIGAASFPFVILWLEEANREAELAIGSDEFARKWGQGEQLPLSSVIPLALAELETALVLDLPESESPQSR